MVQVRSGRIYEFDDFQLRADERLLLRRGEPVALHGKAFEMLLVLVSNRGRLLTKDELFGMVWPDQIVEESNLTVNMSAIRRALDERASAPRHITTISGRGYRFTGEVREAACGDEELTVEQETFTRIVIEHEDASIADQDQRIADSRDEKMIHPMPSGQSALPERKNKQLVLAPSSLRAKKRVRDAMLAAAALLSVLLASGVIGFWRYRERQAARAPLPVPQITMRRFTTHGGIPYRVAISPDGKMLVYMQQINGKDSLWLGQIETNTSVPLNQQQDLRFDYLVFTPDGSNIYFNVSGANRPQVMLARMPVLGGVMTELIPRVESPVTFAPDGKQMAFLRRHGETWEMIIADSDGQSQRTLISRKAAEQFSSRGLSWSPDGKTIAFCVYNTRGQEEILSVSVADGSVSRIGRRDWGSVERVVWLRDGSGVLVLVGENVGERVLRIWLVSHPDGEARPITDHLNVFLRDATLSVSAEGKLAAVLQGHVQSEIWIAPHGDVTQARRVLRGVVPRFEGVDGLAWTPDGRLLYTAYVGNSQVIWSMNSDGSDLRQLTSHRANTRDGSMCVTADGLYVVFHSNRSGSLEIWRVSSDGSNLKQLTTGGHNAWPSLSPDGRWVIYTAAREGKDALWRISIDGGEPTQITETSSSLAQVSPDGRYIASIGSSPERLLIVPFEGGEPVKSFALQERRRLGWTPDGKAILYPNASQGLWRQVVNEEKPQSVKGFEELSVHRLAWSFDGKNLAYTTGPLTQEIILIENFR